MAFNIFDRFLSEYSIKCSHLQLVGITAQFIAGKFEEIFPPSLKSYSHCTKYSCTEDDIMMQEGLVLNTLKINLVYTSSLYYYELFATMFELREDHEKHYYLGLMLQETSQLEFSFYRYRPSVLAFSIISFVTRLVKYKMQKNLARTIKTTEEEVRECCLSVFLLWKQLKQTQIKNITKKYESAEFCCVSKLDVTLSI